MRIFKIIVYACLFSTSYNTFAQTRKSRCGYDIARRLMSSHSVPLPQNKSTNDTTLLTVPVIFHIVLNRTQISKLGGEAGIRQHIQQQLKEINNDFSANNADIIQVPDAFKPAIGKANIYFQLAHTKPDGSATEGYELTITEKKGFKEQGDSGSGYYFSGVKFESDGGTDSWDVYKYVNIWVANLLDDDNTSDFLGVTLNPFSSQNTIYENEIGIVISYHSWDEGRNGRILTHEMGHYFRLPHIWGPDDFCLGSGGEDDNFDDTPPQAAATYGCPTFPLYDDCTTSGAGIMFHNLMDYTDESCQMMFTNEQAAFMRSEITNGVSFRLIQHPELLQWPAMDPSRQYRVYPIPSTGSINVYFPSVSQDLRALKIINCVGRVVLLRSIEQQERFYNFDISELPYGIYFPGVTILYKLRIEENSLELERNKSNTICH